MGISHSWNGTVLTITSDSGTSSADLKGDMGIRGPQGPAGGGGGLSDDEKTIILELLRNAVFTKDMSATFAQLETLWSGSGEGEPDIPGGDEPIDPEEPHTHSYTSSVTTAATCDTAGVRTYTCSCGHSYTEAIPATGHNYVDGTCANCGAADPDAGARKDVSWDDGDGITLTADDIMYGYSLDKSKPSNTPPQTLLGRTDRAIYPHFDIPIEYGYKYKFKFESTSPTAQIGLQFNNAYAQDNYASKGIDGHVYDPGWQENGCEIVVPEQFNGYPIVSVRMTWRKDTSNSTVDDGMITSVTITRTEVA